MTGVSEVMPVSGRIAFLEHEVVLLREQAEADKDFIRQYQADVKELKLDNGLFEIHFYDKAVLLKSCEKALAERDAEIKELKQANETLFEDYQLSHDANKRLNAKIDELKQQLSEQVVKEVNAKCVKCGSRLFETHTPQLLNTIKADAVESAVRQVVSDYGYDNYPHVQDFVEIIKKLRKGE
jgi:chromosome segregation ATPase